MGYTFPARIGAGFNPEAWHAERVDGYNPLAVIDAFRRKKALLEKKEGPALLDVVTYRYSGHSPSDQGSYRTKEEMEAWLAEDCIKEFGDKLVKAKVATQADLEESIEVVIAGYQKKNAILTDQEKKIVAYHEIGHALVAAKQTNSAPVQKITIIPRTSGALGYTLQVENNDHYLMNKQELENKIATFTGGRAAEELVFGSITTGAANDIEQATKLARAMITRYGMSEDFDMVAMETVTNQYLGGDTSLACSAETQSRIDEQVVELVRKQHEKALNILKDNRGKLDELASYLYEHETITGEEFMQILNAA